MSEHRHSPMQRTGARQPAAIQAPRKGASRRALLLLSIAGIWLAASSAWAQSPLTISIAYQGPSAPTNGGTIDPGGAYIVYTGPMATPYLFWGPTALGIGPGIYNSAEVDALSWGRDSILQRQGDYWAGNYQLFFSTDEFAFGVPTLGTPSVRSEGARLLMSHEASADIQRTGLFFVAPPLDSPYGHVSIFDGNNLAPWFSPGPGLGLIEPNVPNIGPDNGDTVDALDIWMQSSAMRLYFSLDADWTDPLESFYANAGTAQANAVDPGDVLVSNGLETFSVWAPASALGLDSNDDLDALILWENGNGVFDPSAEPFDWMDGSTDMLLFSVRRGSPVIETIDSFRGLPIEPGDILTTPLSPSSAPAIFIRAESIGLATVRSGMVLFDTEYGDDLDAMMVR